MPRKSTYLLLSVVAVVLDQLTKVWVRSELPLYVQREVIPNLLNFTHVENSGVAFGWLAAEGETSRVLLLTGLGLFALLVVGVYFWQTPRHERRVLIALSLVLGGAVGNLIDRVLAGHVTDFIDFYVGTYHWHTFNVADSAITIGIALLCLDIVFGGHRATDADAAPKSISDSADPLT